MIFENSLKTMIYACIFLLKKGLFHKKKRALSTLLSFIYELFS